MKEGTEPPISETPRAPAGYRSRCLVSVPARVSICVTDMNQLGPGNPGGGNSGFALDLRCRLHLRLGDHQQVTFALDASSGPARNDYLLLMDHALATWHRHFRPRVNYSVNIQQAVPQHIGLASSAAIQTALYVGLNWLHGNFLSDRHLRSLVSASYREVVGSKLVPAMTTGLSVFLNLYGGFAFLNNSCDPIIRLSAPPWSYLLVTMTGLSGSVTAIQEQERTLRRARELDAMDLPQKLRILQYSLVPAVERGDVHALGKAVEELEHLGGKRAELEFYGGEVSRLLTRLREVGIPCAFMSAAGPAVLTLGAEGVESLESKTKGLGLESVAKGRLDNEGVVVATTTAAGRCL